MEILNFYEGRYYVKVMTYDIENPKDILINTANLVSEKLDYDNEVVTVFELFPKEGKKDNSEKYIHKNFMGYKTLSGVFTVEYQIKENYFEMFLIEKDNDKICRQVLEDYLRSIKLDPIEFKEGKLLVKDPYQGDYNIIWNKNILIGAINYSDAKLAEKYLELMNATIKSHHQ